MNNLIKTTISTGLFVLLLGCDADSSVDSNTSSNTSGQAKGQATSQAKAPAAASSGKMYAKEITKKPCDWLSVDAVATVAGVAASAVSQQKISSICNFKWDSGGAFLGQMRVSKSLDSARSSFETSYVNQSAEQVADSLAQMSDGIKKKSEAGETDVNPESVKVVTNAMSGAFSGGFKYEEVSGLGDMAFYETTRSENAIAGQTFVSYANTLHVLVGNLKFTVTFNRDGDPKMYKDETIALARDVLKTLPN